MLGEHVHLMLIKGGVDVGRENCQGRFPSWHFAHRRDNMQRTRASAFVILQCTQCSQPLRLPQHGLAQHLTKIQLIPCTAVTLRGSSHDLEQVPVLLLDITRAFPQTYTPHVRCFLFLWGRKTPLDAQHCKENMAVRVEANDDGMQPRSCRL